MFLTKQELLRLTGKVRASSQQKALNKMGVPYRVRADGQTLVLSESVLQHFAAAESRPKSKGFKLNLSNA